jgi:predicted flap endonuclease-1-like 5' DNA nuclease
MGSIDTIEGIGVKNATRLRKARIRTTEALLKRGATRAGRREVAAATGLTAKQILEWVNRADLMRVKGIGEEYSDLLEAAGVDTVKELRNRKPENLLARVVEINGGKRLVRRLPTLKMVERWVEHAKELPPVVKY